MNAAVKLLTAHYPASQITWARFTGHLIVMLLVFLPQYGWGLLRTRRPAVQIGRSLLMLASNLLFVMAIGRVPLATASAIGFTSPLIVTALSVPLLRESVGWRRWSAVLVGFAGALLVIRPGSGFTIRRCCCCCCRRWPTRCTRSRRAGSPLRQRRDRHHLRRAVRLAGDEPGDAVRLRAAAKRCSTARCSAAWACSAAPGITW